MNKLLVTTVPQHTKIIVRWYFATLRLITYNKTIDIHSIKSTELIVNMKVIL